MASNWPIGVGDVLLAVHKLRPNDRSSTAIVEMLGFGLIDVGDGDGDDGDEDTTRVDADDGGDFKDGYEDLGPPETLVPVAHESGTSPASATWLSAEPIAQRSATSIGADLPHDPLLEMRTTPGVVAAAASTIVESDLVDADALVDIVASGRPISRLPFSVRRSLLRGVQVLVDCGVGMEPFARDQVQLAGEIEHIIGRNAVEQLSFRDAPLRGVLRAGRWKWHSYQPPAPGTPVLALTDLGIGRPLGHVTRARPQEWVALAEQLQRRGSELIAFVPYPSTRWPRSLLDAVTIAEWDRGTTMAAVLASRMHHRGSA